MFFKKDDGNGLKMQCALAKTQINIVMNKKKAKYNMTRRKIADRLRQGIVSSDFSMAKVEVESIVIDDLRFKAVARIQIFLELLTQRCKVLAQAKQMPPDMYESICTVIFASSQLAEYDGLQDVSKLLINKFSKHHGGKDFVRQVTSGDYNSIWQINAEVATCLSTRAPSAEEKKWHLQQIAAEYNITLDEALLDAKLGIVARAPPPPSPPRAVPTSNTRGRGRGTGGGGVAVAAAAASSYSYGSAPVQEEPTIPTRSSAPPPQPRPSQQKPPPPSPKQTTTNNKTNQQNGSETARTAGSTSNTPFPVKSKLQQLDSGIAPKMTSLMNWNNQRHSGSMSSGSSAAPSRMQSGGSALAEEKGEEEQPPPGLQEEDSVSTPFPVPPAVPVSTVVNEEDEEKEGVVEEVEEEEEEEFNPPGVPSSTIIEEEEEEEEEDAPPSPPPEESPLKPSTTGEEAEVVVDDEKDDVHAPPSVVPPPVPDSSPSVPAVSVDSTSLGVPPLPPPSSSVQKESQMKVVDAPVEEEEEEEEDELQQLFARLKSRDLGQ